jgi:hypothetical protein
LKLFEPAFEVPNVANDSNISCSIHIRRGDYITKYSDVYEKLTPSNYYDRAKDLIKADEYILFSDDKRYRHCADYVELFMMSKCNHNIIANSSFSWWGAYLNQNPEKKVIAPAKWYKSESGYSAKDIYTKNMILV